MGSRSNGRDKRESDGQLWNVAANMSTGTS